MKIITLKSILLSIVFAFSCTLISQSQELLFEIPLSNQVENSSQIIEGKVISKQSFWDATQQNIYTVNTIEVYKIFKGEYLSTVEVITEGGVVGLDAEVVTPSLTLTKNDVGVFLLHNTNIQLTEDSSVSRFLPYSSVQGFYKYNIQDNKASNPFSTRNGITSQLYNELTTLTNNDIIYVSDYNINDEINNVNSIGRGGLVINDFSPMTITAGTKSILTINGGGFGTVAGTVQFSDANFGGAQFFTPLDSQIISWTPTQILVEVPDRAGTGNFRVVTDIGFNVTSSTNLVVPFAEINVESDAAGTLEAYQTQHIDENGSGGYTWQMHIDFNNNTAANQSFTRAFETWVCETGINWEIGSFTAVDVAANDGVNIIRFDNGSELPGGVLGRNTSRFSGCFQSGTLKWFVSELDIVFNDSTNWYYGTGSTPGSQYDFESVAVHELGHGHQMAHVIDTNAIMHYAIANGQFNRILSTNDINGGNDVQSRSTSTAVCGNGVMTDSACSLSLDDNFISDNISIYPIPTKNQLFIKTTFGITLDNAIIYDVTGKYISTIDLNNNSNFKNIDLSQLSSGMYFIKISTVDASFTRKFIIE